MGSRRTSQGHRLGSAAAGIWLSVAAALSLLAPAVGAEPDERPVPWASIEVRTGRDAARAWSTVRTFFGNLRQGHAHEVWVVDPQSAPPARPMSECLSDLAQAGLAFPRVDRSCRLSAQVRVDGPVDGVLFSASDDPDAGIDLGCELALRLPPIARVLKGLGIVRVDVGSPARASARSYHRFGLGLDVSSLGLDDGTSLVVERDFVRQADRGTCEGAEPADPRAARLRGVACSLFDSRLLSTVITPNYNRGHRDHFHWDVRPGDERFYLR